MKRNFALLCMAVLVVVSCQPKTQAPVVNIEGEKAAVNAMIDKYNVAFETKNVDSAISYLTEDALVIGTDPSEFWSKKEITDYWTKAFADTSLKIDMKIDKIVIRVAADGKSAVFTQQFFIPPISEKIAVRAVGHTVKTDADWKIDYMSWSMIPKNEDLPRLNEAMNKPAGK